VISHPIELSTLFHVKIPQKSGFSVVQRAFEAGSRWVLTGLRNQGRQASIWDLASSGSGLAFHPMSRIHPAHDAWYKTSRWQKTARYQLRKQPWCSMCRAEGKDTFATVADHVVPHHGDPNLFWFGRLQSLCSNHHNSGKRFEEIRGFSRQIGNDGWPIDPKHPANKASVSKG
jgi:5-methylcytosine-specific restriction enzyme A